MIASLVHGDGALEIVELSDRGDDLRNDEGIAAQCGRLGAQIRFQAVDLRGEEAGRHSPRWRPLGKQWHREEHNPERREQSGHNPPLSEIGLPANTEGYLGGPTRMPFAANKRLFMLHRILWSAAALPPLYAGSLLPEAAASRGPES